MAFEFFLQISVNFSELCAAFDKTQAQYSIMAIDIKEFIFSLPGKVSPDALEGQNSVFHFDFGDAGIYTVALNDGKLDVAEGLQGEPSCTVKTSAESFNKILSGDLNPMMAMMTGKLKISNPGEMLKYAKMFGIMK